MMAKIAPVDLEATVVKGVDHLVCKRVLHVLLVHEAVLAHKDSVLGREAADPRLVAGVALHCRRRKVAACESELLQHEDDHGACLSAVHGFEEAYSSS